MKLATNPAPPLLLPFDAPDAFWRAVERLYATPRRYYHCFQHIEHLVDELCRLSWDHVPEVYLAGIFHDAVYDVERQDNEARSALVARFAIERWLPSLEVSIPLVERLILLTARHGQLGPGDVNDEEALFLDCDMAILATHPRTYDAYEDAVAAEYAAVCTPEQWAAGRRAFVESLLARPRIFLSSAFAPREQAARRNLHRALHRLEARLTGVVALRP